jgi:hypothetical protein
MSWDWHRARKVEGHIVCAHLIDWQPHTTSVRVAPLPIELIVLCSTRLGPSQGGKPMHHSGISEQRTRPVVTNNEANITRPSHEKNLILKIPSGRLKFEGRASSKFGGSVDDARVR